MSAREKILKTVLPIFIILCGVGIMAVMIVTRPEPKREIRNDPGALVQTLTLEKKKTHRIIVSGTGTVQAAQEVSLIPQVSGQIVAVSPSMVAGGFFHEGEVLFEIDDRDYRLALQQAKASLAKADYDLTVTENQASVARSEWERLFKEEDPNPLVLYEPQLKNALAARASAEAAISKAELDLERTTVRAPFNCRVRSENVAPGQYVRSGTSVAVVASTDRAEILVPLPLSELIWLHIPAPGTEVQGSRADVSMSIAGKTYAWQGTVVRSLGEVDPKSRMMHIVIAVQDPYGLTEGGDDRPGLSAGTFVEVTMQGRKLSNVFSLPRTALRDDATVWIMDDENRLRIRSVKIAYRERTEVLISAGLSEGERVVLTPLAGASDGMKLRSSEKEEPQ